MNSLGSLGAGGLSDAIGLSLLLAVGRLGPLLLSIPALGWLGRLGLLAAGGALLLPLLLPLAVAQLAALPAPSALWLLLPLLLHELGVGLLLLLGALLLWAGLRAAGRLLELELPTPPEGSAPSPAVSELLSLLALALLFALDGGPLLVRALARTYELAPLPPPGQLPMTALTMGTSAAIGLTIKAGGQLLTTALVLALPLLTARLLALLALSLLQRSLGYRLEQWTAPTAFLIALLTLAGGLYGLTRSWQHHLHALPRLLIPS